MKFKNDIMKEIVTNRVYKEPEVLEVFQRHRDAEHNLDPYWINQVLVELSTELYIPL
jgi:hypothetical protein